MCNKNSIPLSCICPSQTQTQTQFLKHILDLHSIIHPSIHPHTNLPIYPARSPYIQPHPTTKHLSKHSPPPSQPLKPATHSTQSHKHNQTIRSNGQTAKYRHATNTADLFLPFFHFGSTRFLDYESGSNAYCAKQNTYNMKQYNTTRNTTSINTNNTHSSFNLPSIHPSIPFHVVH